MLDRILLYTAIVVGMLPVTVLWFLGMHGLLFFFEEALRGRPIGFVYLLTGTSGIVGVTYLFLLIELRKSGSLILALSLIIPAWIGLIQLIVEEPHMITVLVSMGPISVSLLLLYLAWPQLKFNGISSISNVE